MTCVCQFCRERENPNREKLVAFFVHLFFKPTDARLAESAK